MERRIAGLGRVEQAPRVPLPVPRRVVERPHPNTPAYDQFGGGYPTPFNDWTSWTSTFNPLIRPEWIFNMPTPPRIGSEPRHGGPITNIPVRFGTFRNVPFFKAEFKLRDPPRYPEWPCGAPFFKFTAQTKDDQRKSQMWPHVPANNYGDVPVVLSRYLRVLPWALPSGTYIQARERRLPKHYVPNTHQIHPRAMYYEPGTKPGLQERVVKDEQWFGVKGLGETTTPFNWGLLAAVLAVPGALWALKHWKK